MGLVQLAILVERVSGWSMRLLFSTTRLVQLPESTVFLLHLPTVNGRIEPNTGPFRIYNVMCRQGNERGSESSGFIMLDREWGIGYRRIHRHMATSYTLRSLATTGLGLVRSGRVASTRLPAHSTVPVIEQLGCGWVRSVWLLTVVLTVAPPNPYE